eukprot:gene3139-4946_t
MPSRTVYVSFVAALAGLLTVLEMSAGCHGPQCQQSRIPVQLLQMASKEDMLRLVDQLSTDPAGDEAAAVAQGTLEQPRISGAAKSSPHDDDPMYVPWDELAQFGYSKDEPFRGEFAKRQAASRAESYARFAAIREENLAKLRVRGQERPLAGLEPRFARAISTVCDLEEDSEERQMCERRGRRKVENIRQEYSGRLSFTHEDAKAQFEEYAQRTVKMAKDEERAGQTFRIKSHFVKVMIASGRIVGHHTAGYKKYGKSYFSNQEAVALAWLEGVLRTLPLGNRDSITCEILLQVDDMCNMFNPRRNSPKLSRSYPLVAYSKRPDWCPHITTLMWDSIVQHGFFNATAPQEDAPREVVDFRSLKSRMTFRGSGWSRERYFFAAVSASRLLPYVDAGITNWRHTCRKNIGPVFQGLDTNVLRRTPYANPITACGPNGQENNASSWTPQRAFKKQVSGLEVARNEKYLLLVDGFSALFRLAPNLKLPGIVFLHPHSRYELPYYPDLLPFVHYVPLRLALNQALSDLDHAYHWLEENPDIAEDIATRSTRFAKKHVSEDSSKQYKREWHVFLAILNEMYTTPPEEVEAAVDPHARPFSCASNTTFQVFHPAVKSFAAKHELPRLACG